MTVRESAFTSTYLFAKAYARIVPAIMRITKNHKVEDQYICAVLQEWKRYLDIFQKRPIIRELHIGGGTPTFFSLATCMNS